MSISLCITKPCGSPSTIAMQSSQATSSTVDRDREANDGGEKVQNTSKTYRKAVMPQYQHTAVPMMYGSNKSQKYYNNSSNRKKQQHIINSLKSWNLQIAPSGLDKPDDELSTVNAATSQKKELARAFVSKCTVPAKAVQETCTSGSVGESIKTSSKKKLQEFKSNKCKPEETKDHALTKMAALKIDRDFLSNSKEPVKNKHTKPFDLTTEESVVGDNAHNHASSAHLSVDTMTSQTTETSSGCVGEVSAKPITAIAVAESQPVTASQHSFTLRGNHQKHSHKAYARSSTTNTVSSSAVPNSVPYNLPVETAAEGSRNGKDCATNSGQSHVSVMSLMLQGNTKQNESVRLDYFSDNLSVASSHSKTIHPNQQISQNQGSYIPTLGAQQLSKQQTLINRPDHHHSAPQTNNTSPSQYKFDFLRDVGLKMSLNNVAGGGNSSTGEISMYRGSSQVNYNFTQQFQQHMMQHHQTNQIQHQNHSSGHQSPHQQHQLLQLHQIIPQQPQYGRSQNVYGGDELSAQHCGLSDPQGFTNLTLLNAVEGHSSINVGKNFELSSYLYNQNSGAMHSQHQAMHYKQQLLEQQLQQHPAQMQTYHQNNNYQYHNRNGHGQGGNQLSYSSQGAGRVIGTVTGREEGVRNGANGRKLWNAHGKGRNNSYQANGSKQVSKMQSTGFGYRKNYQHYYNHPVSGGNHYYEHITIQQHQQQQQQAQSLHHHKQKHLHRNLVYVRGYDRGHGAVSSHEYTNGNRHQEVVQTELTHSAPASPPEANNQVEDTSCSESIQKNGDNEPKHKESQASSHAQDALIYDVYREQENGQEKAKASEMHGECVYGSRKLCSVPRSSSSSSVVSIPSTESSVMSCNTSQLESTLANGHDYESDSSHSSDYREGTFNYSKYNDTNDSKGIRSSSSTSSGVSSSSTTYPPLNEFVPSAPSSLHASTSGLAGEFIVRSQSFHGSHQNLIAYGSGGGTAGGDTPTAGSPKSIPRMVTGTQSVPVFGELFGNTNHCQPNPIPFIHSQSAGNFGSSSSLELALHSAATSSSSSSSLSASSVPPNDFLSMQSGHPKTRSQSGRTSPTSTNVHYRSNTSTIAVSSTSLSNTSKGQLSNAGTGRKNIHGAISSAIRPALLGDFHQTTPADRFILRANDVEMKVPPDALTNGSIWDNLSKAIWERFAAAQQSEAKYIEKMELWRELYICIKKGFPKYSLYLVGSTISGFGADSSDVDMCLVSRSGPSCYDHRLEALFSLSLVKEYFMNMPSSSFSEFSLIQAKVPILRFQENKNGIEVDLNFNNCVGIRNTHLLHCYSQMDWRVRPLVLMVKLWAQHHNINDAKNMTISSYSLVLMVIHFLQCGTTPPVLPCLHAMYPEKFMKIVDIHNIEMIERIEPHPTDNKESLGELLLNFLEYYTRFDYERFAISVRTSSIIPIEECRLARSYKNDPHNWKHLCIEEPFDFTNTARSVFDGDVFEQIKSTFATSWRMLKDSKNLNVLFGEPLFTPVTSTLSITS